MSDPKPAEKAPATKAAAEVNDDAHKIKKGMEVELLKNYFPDHSACDLVSIPGYDSVDDLHQANPVKVPRGTVIRVAEKDAKKMIKNGLATFPDDDEEDED